MLPLEREQRILEILDAQKTVSTEELSHLLGVSEMTVRRDLERCHREGKLQRCHGGASVVPKTVMETDYGLKIAKRMDVKRELAKAAAALVKPGMTVYLDAGTSTYCLAQEICLIPDLTVITNDLKIALLLQGSEAEVIVLGGKLQKRTGSMLGGSALQQLQSLRATIAFIGAASIDDQLETLTPTEEKVSLKQTIRSISQYCYLIADASKFSSFALYAIAPLSSFDGVITDAAFTEAQKQIIGKKTLIIRP